MERNFAATCRGRGRSGPVFLLCALTALLLPGASAATGPGWSGRFDLGTFAWLPSDPDLDGRFSVTSRLRLGWTAPADNGWSFSANVRIRGEAEGEGLSRLAVWDLRADYGLGRRRLAGSAGVATMTEVAGLGAIAGAHLQLNLPRAFSCGVFGGGHPAFRLGITDLDGSKFGGYLRWEADPFNGLGIGYVNIAGTDYEADEQSAIVFDGRLNAGRRLFAYHNGEIRLQAAGDQPSGLTFYNATVRYDIVPRASVGLMFSHFDRRPYLPFKDELEPSRPVIPGADGDGGEKTSSLSPRIDVKLSRTWRMHARYRQRTSDLSGSDAWQQWLGGVSCSNVLGSGLRLNASGGTTDRGTFSYQSGYISLGKELSRRVSIDASYAMSRNVYPENQLAARNADGSHRAGLSLTVAASKTVNFLLDYERSFGGDSEEDQLLVNARYWLR